MFKWAKKFFKQPEVEVPSQSPQMPSAVPAIVRIPDGRFGIVDHLKSDGKFGVRPVNVEGVFYPNPSKHWTNEQRMAIPEELALSAEELSHVTDEELPSGLRKFRSN